MAATNNRLAISHLLLWTATTGIALAYLLEQEPPPAESIEFASFLTSPGQDVKAEKAKAQQRTHRAWQMQYEIGLAASPVYGAALAGAALAIWRVATRRFGFPTQPGHWLLVVLACLSVLFAARPWCGSIFNSANGPDFALAIVMTAIATGVTIALREPLWRCAMGLWSVGWGLVSVAYVISFNSTSIEPPGLLPLGGLVLVIFPLAALICSTVDITERERFDAFHWIGVATLIGVVAHFLAAWLAVRQGPP